MPLINDTNFVGSINLAQMGQSEERANLNSYVARLEPEFLQLVLGDYGITVTYPEFDNTSFIIKLREYLRYAEARYVYWFYLRDLNTTSTVSGKAVMKKENAVKISPDEAMATAWNEMITKLQLMYQYMRTTDYFSEFDYCTVTPLSFQNTFGL